MASGLDALRESFLTLQQLPLSLVEAMRAEAGEEGLTAQRLAQLRSQATPLCKLHYLDPQGEPVFSQDQVPVWLAGLLMARLPSDDRLTLIRPLPPGMEVGRVRSRPLADLPENYLLAAARLPSGPMVACELDLDVVFGIWLLRPLIRSGLENDISVRRLSPHEPWQPEIVPPPTVDLERWLWPWEVAAEQPQWRWQVETLFPREPYSFQTLEIGLSNRAALTHLLREQLISLAFSLCLMLAFAFCIYLTARAVRTRSEAAEAREQFVGMVSHELRTPLAAIEMYLEILREGLVDDPDKLEQYHQILAAESNRLKSLVENLLAMGTLQNSAELKKEVLDLHDLASEVAGQHNARVRLGLEASPSLTLANRDALWGVLSNLIGNALKYGERAEVRTSNQEDRLILEVEDEGPGIPSDQRAKIFEPYYRIETAGGERKSGVGLGLALTRGLVEAMEGTISVHDGAGGGALFRVSLPLAERREQSES